MSTLSEAGLYYPYVNFRSDPWIKAAILHWPLFAKSIPSATCWQ